MLYYPNDETYVITNDSLELALNEAGAFEFDIPRDNLRFDDFNIRSGMIQVKQNEEEIFYGEVREVTDNFDFTRHVYAVGELAFLFDSIQPQKVYKCSPLQMFTEVINIHNSQVEPRKQFAIGEVSVTDPNDYVYHFTNREDTLTVLREKLCKTLNGYLKITKRNGVRYINLVPLSRYGKICTQEIQFGENLLDYAANNSGAKIATSVVPIGAIIDEDKRTSRAVEGLDEYVTIVNTGVDKHHKKTTDDYLVNDEAVARFGHVRVVKEWSNITQPDNLKKKAIEWLTSVQYSELTLDISAFDLNLMDINIDSFNLGDIVSVWAKSFGMENVAFPVQKKTICMSDLEKNRMVLGNSYTKSYSSQASEAMNAIIETLPEVSPILQSAKDNSRRILEGTDGGHVIFQFDKNGDYIEQLIICDGPTEKKSLNKWVWNLGGFGYLKRKNFTDPWTDLGVAMTMDGKIVADFMTTGILTLAGSSNNPNYGAFLKVYDGNTLIGYWGADGIKINKGEMNINNQFIVHTDGSCESKNGLFYNSKDNYINLGKKGGDYPEMLHLHNSACKVSIDSAGRFCLDRMEIANNAKEGQSGNVLFDTSGMSYNNKKITWSKLFDELGS